MMKGVLSSWFVEVFQSHYMLRLLMQHQLKLIKTNNHSLARSKWYDWKYSWITNLLAWGDNTINDLVKVCVCVFVFMFKNHIYAVARIKRSFVSLLLGLKTYYQNYIKSRDNFRGY